MKMQDEPAMIEFRCDPPTPSKPVGHAFVQTIRMLDGGNEFGGELGGTLGGELGRATWSSTDPSQGVAQILDLWIDPSIRRSGNGKRLLSALVKEAELFNKVREQPLRRLWIGVGHKTGVVARSFLTSCGFHHVASTCGLLEDQDLLIYIKSLD